MDIRIIIAGSREFNDYELLRKSILDCVDVTQHNVTIISGTARGADQLGEKFALEYKLDLIRMPADWNLYGKSAGYIRNKKMAEYAAEENGMLFAFWDGASRGTMHMIKLAQDNDLDVHIIKYEAKGA